MHSPRTNSPITWIPSAYFAMGLPFMAISLASVIMFVDLGISEAQITFWTSLLLLPYTLKFIWSPLLEIYLTKKTFALCCQAISGLCFGLIAFLLPVPEFFSYVIAIMGVMALSGATNDIATDGIYLTAIDKKTQAEYIGWQGAFYNLARVLVNGGLVYLAGVLITYFKATDPENAALHAWMIVVGIMAAVMIAVAVYHWFVLPIGSKAEDASSNFSSAMRSLTDVILSFFAKPYIWVYILFIICYRFTEGFAIKMVPLFLKASAADGGLGLDNEEIGLIYGTLGTIAFIIGSILGGYYTAHFGLRKVIFSLVCIFNVPFVIYLLFAQLLPSSIYIIGAGLVAEYFCYGFGYVGLTLFMMQQVAPGKAPMSHYAFASAIANLGFMIPGMFSGWLFADVLGRSYAAFFTIALVMSIPAFVLALKVPFTHTQSEQQ